MRRENGERGSVRENELSAQSLTTKIADAGLQKISGRLAVPNQRKSFLYIDVGLSSSAPHSARWLTEDADANRIIVFGFEPLLENLEDIRACNSVHPHPDKKEFGERFFLFPFALSDQQKSRLFYVTEDTGQASLYPPAKLDSLPAHLGHMKEAFTVLRTEKIDTMDLDSVLARIENLPPLVGFLKTDCQGGDLEVLRGARRTLSKTVFVTSEVSSGQYPKAPNSRFRLLTYMTSAGFFYLHKPLRRLLSRVTGCEINTQDPTFVNLRFVHKLHRLKLSIWQYY